MAPRALRQAQKKLDSIRLLATLVAQDRLLIQPSHGKSTSQAQGLPAEFDWLSDTHTLKTLLFDVSECERVEVLL
ncbi:hypothetical protein KKC44_01615 [Patescibacteria group bacterium]|nr:hypothetical protein [Patescibacteria group bacterium]MBU2259279.1 hypothetical protein [Patescibacteria group bacterium]